MSHNHSHASPISMKVGQDDNLIHNAMHAGITKAETLFGGSFICHSTANQINSKGIWFGDDPLAYYLPVLLLQLCLIFNFTHFIHLILKPFGQPSFVSQIIVSMQALIFMYFIFMFKFLLVSSFWFIFCWLLWLVAEVNAEIMVVDKVKTKRCNRLHTSDTQQISLKTKNCYK